MDLEVHIRYHRSASLQVLSAVERLQTSDFSRPVVSSFPSVRSTLLHTLSADIIWLARVKGRRVTFEELPQAVEFSEAHHFRSIWTEVLDEWVEAVEGQDPHYQVEFRTISTNEPGRHRLEEVVRHVVNHGTYHRGQVTTLLRQLGAEPVATDIIP